MDGDPRPCHGKNGQPNMTIRRSRKLVLVAVVSCSRLRDPIMVSLHA